MRYTLCLIVLLMLAGCTIGSFGDQPEQEQPVELAFNNTYNESRTFRVWVVKGEIQPDGIVIHKKSGEVDDASPGEGLSSYQLGGDYGYVTSIEPPPDRSQFFGELVLQPGEVSRKSIENFTVGSTVVVSMSKNGRVIELTTANCAGQALVGLALTVRHKPPGDAIAAYECR